MACPNCHFPDWPADTMGATEELLAVEDWATQIVQAHARWHLAILWQTIGNAGLGIRGDTVRGLIERRTP